MNISFKKRLGYSTYGALYNIFKLLPVRDNLAYFIMTHDSSDEGNCGVMKAFLENYTNSRKYFLKWPRKGFTCRTLTRLDTYSPGFIVKSAWNLARSRYVFMDNAFLPLAFFKLRSDTTLVQLWHGTGTIKKFGQHVNEGDVKALEARCARNISYVTVSSEATRDIYSECFDVPVDKVAVTGLPRTDAFFREGFAEESRRQLEDDYPVLKGKKLILYAPTFRDEDRDCAAQLKIIRQIAQMITDVFPDDVYLGLHLHPFVAQQASTSINPDSSKLRIIDLSGYQGINTILGSTDVLISDYSSIIFEYSILGRPMIFYAYDLAEFESDGRGFYRNYHTYVPGPIATTLKELELTISKALETPTAPVREGFIEDSFAFTDGRSARRIYELISE